MYYFVVSAWKRPATAMYRVPRYQEQQKPQNLPQVQWKEYKKNLVHMKSPQAQNKTKIQKFFFQPSQAQVVPKMFMPYIEGPKMEWTINGGLYHRFIKWHLKCENILECELAMLPERRQCKKVTAWSGDFFMDWYVSWNLSNEELMLDTIWEKFEKFCKPQSNEVRARFDLLTNFQQGNKSVDEWYNAVHTQVALAKYPPETGKIFYRDNFLVLP